MYNRKTKPCSKCKKRKYLKDFKKDKKRRDGLSSWCKKCHRESNKEGDWKSDPNKHRDAHLKRVFNITLDDYNRILNSQKGVCAICGLPESNKRMKNLAVDHNHNTGKVRGLLCRNCNIAIGALNTDNFGILNLKKAIEYLTNVKSI